MVSLCDHVSYNYVGNDFLRYFGYRERSLINPLLGYLEEARDQKEYLILKSSLRSI